VFGWPIRLGCDLLRHARNNVHHGLPAGSPFLATNALDNLINKKEIPVIIAVCRQPLPAKELAESIKFVKKYHEGIVEKWTNFFVKNKKVKCEVITQKIK
jgi:hypothetical protein